MAEICEKEGYLQNAMSYYSESLLLDNDLAFESGITQDNRILANSYLNVAQLYMRQGKTKEAREKCLDGISVMDKQLKQTGHLSDARLLSNLYQKLGDTFKIQGDHEQANKYYELGFETEKASII